MEKNLELDTMTIETTMTINSEIIQSPSHHSKDLTEASFTCNCCNRKVCESCSVIQQTDNSQTIRICEPCLKIEDFSDFDKNISQVKQDIEKTKAIHDEKVNELALLKANIKQAKSELDDFQTVAERRRIKNEKLIKRTMELDSENRVLENKIERYKTSLNENNIRVSAITAEYDNLKRQRNECIKKIQEFEEMIKEQEEENVKILADIEEARTDFEGQLQDQEIQNLDEKELKERVLKLQEKISTVKNENKSLEFHLKVLNDEDRLKSGTISIISEKVSMISGSVLEPKFQQSNELTLQMKNQLTEIMKLYNDINELKKTRKARKKENADALTNKNCKCSIQ